MGDGSSGCETERMELLGVVELGAYADRVAGTLPYGLQRKLEIARALALQPKLLLLDEPAAGMNPQESLELVELIRRIHERMQLTIILIEHHMDVVMNLCERIAVLNFGKKIAEGTPDEIQSNPLVLEAYLGQKVEYAALRVERLNYYYGEAIHALRDVSFEVEEGEIASIIGANGAGKSTLMWTLVGLLKPKSGTITFNGRSVKPIPHQAVASGIALVPERRRLFPNLTVRENLTLGGYLRSDKAGLAKDEEYVFSLFPVSEGASHPVCRDALRRAAADAGDRPGADVSPQAACCWTSRRWAWRRSWCTRCSTPSRRSRARARRSSWSSRTPSRRWRSPPGPTCWRSGGSSCRARGRSSCAIPTVQAAYLGVRQRKEVILEEGSHAH